MLSGRKNCGKSFVLNPLKDIFNAFVDPANSTFAWGGAETAEIVYLNNFRWDEKVMARVDMQNLLESTPVHIAAPKTHFAEYILWTKDSPMFCTSSARIRKYVMRCAIWYHLYNLKNVKNTHGGVLLLVKFTKITLLHGCFKVFKIPFLNSLYVTNVSPYF